MIPISRDAIPWSNDQGDGPQILEFLEKQYATHRKSGVKGQMMGHTERSG